MKLTTIANQVLRTRSIKETKRLTESTVDLASLEPSPTASHEYPLISDLADVNSLSEITYSGKPLTDILKRILKDLWERIDLDIVHELDDTDSNEYDGGGMYSGTTHSKPDSDDIQKALTVSDIVYIPSGEIGIIVTLDTHSDDIEDIVESARVCGMYSYDLDTMKQSRRIPPKKRSGNYQLEDVSEFQLSYAVRLDFDYSNLTEDIHSDFLNAMEDLNEDISNIASTIRKFSSDALNKLKAAFSNNIQEAALLA